MPQDDPPVTALSPVYAAGTALVDLGTAELFVVTVLRLWADPAPPADWPGGFRAAGAAAEGAPAFGLLMWIVGGAARRPLDVRERHCPELGRDEGMLLRLISLLQRDRAAEAAAVLAEWLPPAAVRLAAREAQTLSAALADAGLVVPLRHAEAAAAFRLAACAHATPGLVLLQ